MSGDNFVKIDDPAYDKEELYREDYDVPFMRELLPTFMMRGGS